MKKTNKVNPLEFFRKSAEARQKALKTGGYNVPTQSLPKADKGRAMRDMDKYLSPDPVGRERGDGPGPYANPYTPKPNYGPITEEEAMLQNSGKPNFSNGPTPEEKNGGMMKKGGATKAKKFAALARPFNKATAADRIVGAKKNARKKK